MHIGLSQTACCAVAHGGDTNSLCIYLGKWDLLCLAKQNEHAFDVLYVGKG